MTHNFSQVLPQFRQQLPPTCQLGKTCRYSYTSSIPCFLFASASKKMAPVYNVLRTCGIVIYLILQVQSTLAKPTEPWIVSLKVDEKTCEQNRCKYLLNVHGGEFLGHFAWKLTPREGSRGDTCYEILPDYELREIETAKWQTKIELSVSAKESKIYFCLYHTEKKNSPFGGKWVHQGGNLFLDPQNDVFSPNGDNGKS